MPQHLHDHIKLHSLHYTEMNELYISLSLRAFSVGLVGIFLPIYLYNLHLSILSFALFFMVLFGVKIFVHPISARLAARFGTKHILVLSYFLTFTFIIMLFWLPQYLWLLFPAAILGGISDSTFWLVRHIDYAAVANESKASTEYSVLLIFSNVAASLSPLIGGFIAGYYGIGYALLAAGAGLLAASYPLFKTLEPAVPRKTHLRWLRTAPRRHLAANFAMNFQSMTSVYFWPLFIFLIVRSYQGVGLIASVSLLLLIVAAWHLGKEGDRGKNIQILKIGTRLRIGLHSARFLAQSFPAAMIINIFGDITDLLTSMPYSVRFYQAARQHDISAYLLDMETVGDAGKVVSWAVLLTASIFFSLEVALIVCFFLSAAIMPMLRWINYQYPDSSQYGGIRI